MPKYLVETLRTTTEFFEVEAEDPEQAVRIASERVIASDDGEAAKWEVRLATESEIAP